MLNPSATPTPITPPRVPIIDPRTNLIDRAWYMFFLSLLSAAQTADDSSLGPSAESLVATYDAALRTLAQVVDTAPPQMAFSQPDVLSSSDNMFWFAELQKQIEGLQSTPPPAEIAGATGTFLSADTVPKTVTVVNGIITSIV